MFKITKYHKKMKLVYMGAGLCTLAFLFLNEDFKEFDLKERLDGYYVVKLNNQKIGVAKDVSDIEKIVDDARMEITKNSENIVFMKPDVKIEKQKKDANQTDKATIKKRAVKVLEQSKMPVSQKKEAYILNVDGHSMILNTKEEAVDVLNRVKSQYDTNNQYNVTLQENPTQHLESYSISVDSASEETEGDLKGMTFATNMELISTYANETDIKSTDEVYTELTEAKPTIQRYEVAPGDCISTIANDHDMYVKEFLEINEDLTEDSTIYVGDMFNIMVPKAELSVSTKKRSSRKEYYRAEPKIIEDDSMYQGEEKTISKGKKGYRLITVDTTYVDGMESTHEIVEEETIKEAVPAVIAKGTAIAPSFIRPISGGHTTSGFGYRAIFGDFHLGHDWGIPTGTSVYASCGGTVLSAGWNGSYGLSVLIQHPDGICTRYGHLSSISVSAGDKVSQKQRIGFSGSTGNSTGPHLHFEVIVNGQVVNPLNYVSEY